MNKLKVLKNSLAGIALAGILAGGPSFGTYAWFSSSATVEGKITNSTLAISEAHGKSSMNFNGDELSKGKIVSDSITIKNTGEEPVFMKGHLKLKVTEKSNKNLNEPEILSRYLVKVQIGDKLITDFVESNNISQFNIFKDYMNGPFHPGETVKVMISLKVKDKTNNTYREIKIKPVIIVEAKQIDKGAEFLK
ncbi:SipW-dependent-type signal peptide-containing protein [Bacillus sp. FJAT-27251]|uniref:SipW-dependent-type signal peptide-containing protein n=1 Tax=Bacillus sp. FJAT-27251 TaxID=1684142 RepID=UPI0006A79C93|nr:SipW-dependent-type signal peptide-containing protein [Bacillus sp. FJAT-27251]